MLFVLQVWEADTYKQVSTLPGHSGTVYALAPLNTGSGIKVFSASYDRSLRVSGNMTCGADKVDLVYDSGSENNVGVGGSNQGFMRPRAGTFMASGRSVWKPS